MKNKIHVNRFPAILLPKIKDRKNFSNNLSFSIKVFAINEKKSNSECPVEDLRIAI